jgi:hypothetical protein
MATLDRSFEDDLREAALDAAERELIGRQDNVVFGFIERVHGRLEAYGRAYDYNVQPIIDSLGEVEIDRSGDRIAIRIGWEHEAIRYFEFGTSDHTIEGNPILSFVWEDPPQWVREEFDQARGSGGRFESGWRVFLPEVEVSGIPEARAIRDTLNWLRRELR